MSETRTKHFGFYYVGDSKLLEPGVYNSFLDAVDAKLAVLSAALQSQGVPWLTGDGDPTDNLGIDGNFYLDRVSGNVFLKESGTWR